MGDALPQPIRPLGHSEIYSSSRHALGFYKCVANTCRYSLPLARLGNARIDRVLETAVANVVLALPALSVGIFGQDTSKPYFVQPRSINLEHHLQYLEEPDVEIEGPDTALLSILEQQHDRSWPEIEVRPPWKVTAVVRKPVSDDGLLVLDVVFAVHHSIADGRSTSIFHARLLDELNHPRGRPSQLSGHILTMDGVRQLVAPLEELVDFTQSWSYLIRTLWRELAPAWLSRQQAEAPWTGKAVTREPCRTRLRLITVPAANLSRILATCRASKTTLTPLLHVLVLASLARLKGEEARSFCGSTPIDLRPFMKNASQTRGVEGPFGVFVTSQSHPFPAATIATMREAPGRDEIMNAAAELRRGMKQHLEGVPRDDIVSMLGWVGDWEKFWLEKVGKPRSDTWEVSNIGSMPVNREGAEPGKGWRIQRAIMSQGATVAGAAINLSVAGVTGGDLCIVLGWQENIVETETMDRLAADLRGWLDRLGHGESA
ncbi:hypothetical protein VTK26DRAFT_4762 [Humicola hyalothermophila]